MALWDNLQGKWNLSNQTYTDSSVNANTLTPVNTPSSVAGHGGTTGTACGLDGSTEYAYILNANQTGLNPTSALTISAWIKTPASWNAAPQIIVSKLGNAGQYAYDLYTDNSVHKVNFRISNDGTALTSCIGGTALSTNTTYHIMAVYDGTDMRVYVNGSLDSNGTNNPKTYSSGIKSGTDAFAIGVTPVNPTTTVANYWKTMIDDVAIWSRALSSTEVSTIYGLGDDFLQAGSLSGTIKDKTDTAVDCSTYNVRLNFYKKNNKGNIPTATQLVTSAGGTWTQTGLGVAGTKYMVTYEYEGTYAPLSITDIAGAEFMTTT